MSIALMVHKEANGVKGGFLNPAGSGASADTFYARKLNTLLVNQDSIITSFDAVAYTFTLSPGTFRINVRAVFNPSPVTIPSTGIMGYCLGLYNVTSAQFEVQDAGTIPILATTGNTTIDGSGRVDSNRIAKLSGRVRVTASNKTYQIRHKTNAAGASGNWDEEQTLCGFPDQMSGANVNGAAANQYYMVVSVRRES